MLLETLSPLKFLCEVSVQGLCVSLCYCCSARCESNNDPHNTIPQKGHVEIHE